MTSMGPVDHDHLVGLVSIRLAHEKGAVHAYGFATLFTCW